MNPCRCKTTGICTCCRSEEDSKGDSGIAAASPPAPCCDRDKCCSDSLSTELTPEGTAPLAGKGGCCSGKKQSEPPRAAASSLLPARPSMTREEMEAIVSPPCLCGPNCSCPGCLRESDASTQERATMQANEECPDKCLTCSACAFGLTRPSGIEAVDKWMDKDKEESTEAAEQHELPPKKRAKLESQGHTQVGSIPPPPLPPFPNAAHFFTSHFLDSARPKHFADQIKAADPLPEGDQAGEGDESVENGYGSRRQGESDEDWQIRHGFYYLTPEAIRIFDSARKFREEREWCAGCQSPLVVSSFPLYRSTAGGARGAGGARRAGEGGSRAEHRRYRPPCFNYLALPDGRAS